MAAVRFRVPAFLAPLDPDRLVQRCRPSSATRAYARARRSRHGRLLKNLVAAVELILAALVVAVLLLFWHALSTPIGLQTRAASGVGPVARFLHAGEGYIGIDPITVTTTSDGAGNALRTRVGNCNPHLTPLPPEFARK